MASTIHQRFVSRLPSLEQEMGEELFVSGLVGPYRIFQRKNGHRHGIDDATTAWYALQKTPPVKKTLDLGTGIGTVGLAVLWGLGGGGGVDVCRGPGDQLQAAYREHPGEWTKRVCPGYSRGYP